MASAYRTEVELDPALQVLHAELEQMGMVPGWHRPGRAPMWAEPRSAFVPMHRSYAAAHAALTKAGELVDTALAERRNLILANTESGSLYATTTTQVLAYQMMLPGERARTHRHTAHAGRLILDADEGVFTVVDGVRIFMEPGDVVLTPGWSWHGHGHQGSEPAYWLDFLDVPLVQLLDPMFFEPYPGDWAEPQVDDQRSPMLLSWRESQRRLDEATSDDGPLGARVDLPAPSLSTIGLAMHRMPVGRWTPAFRTSANYQFCVVRGSGTSRVGDTELRWARGDVVVVPSWHVQQHRADDRAVLFSVTDAPVQRYCTYLREQLMAR